MRRRGAALIRAGRLDEAFTVLDRCFDRRADLPALAGAMVLTTTGNVRQRVLDEAAAIATSADGDRKSVV